MKKGNLLSKAEMKKVTGGNTTIGACDNWMAEPNLICFNCCIADTKFFQGIPGEIDYLDFCEDLCM